MYYGIVTGQHIETIQVIDARDRDDRRNSIGATIRQKGDPIAQACLTLGNIDDAGVLVYIDAIRESEILPFGRMHRADSIVGVAFAGVEQGVAIVQGGGGRRHHGACIVLFTGRQ